MTDVLKYGFTSHIGRDDDPVQDIKFAMLDDRALNGCLRNRQVVGFVQVHARLYGI